MRFALASRTLTILAVVVMAASGASEEEPLKVPLDRMAERNRALAESVLQKADFVVPMPRTIVRSRQAVFDYLMDRLVFTAAVVRSKGWGEYHVGPSEKVSGAWILNDGRGVKVRITPLYSAEGMRCYYTKGYYTAGWIPKIRGRAVIVLVYGESDEGVDTRAEIHFRVDSDLVRSVSRPLREMFLDIVEEKSTRFIDAARTVAEVVSEDPDAFYEALLETPGVDREQAEEFRGVFLGPDGVPARFPRPRREEEGASEATAPGPDGPGEESPDSTEQGDP